MNIRSYQGKHLLKIYNINILDSYLVENEEDVKTKIGRMKTNTAIVKTKVSINGNGKIEDVKIVNSVEEAIETGKNVFKNNFNKENIIIKDKIIKKMYFEEICDIAKEFYLCIKLNKKKAKAFIMVSKYGGTDINVVEKNYPDEIKYYSIDQVNGITEEQINLISNYLELNDISKKSLFQNIIGLYNCFIENECNLIEINPLVLTDDDKLIALNSNISFNKRIEY